MSDEPAQDADPVRDPVTGRSADQERMVRFGYYAEMAANLLTTPDPAARLALLEANDYPVLARLREISEWCYDAARNDGVGDLRASAPEGGA